MGTYIANKSDPDYIKGLDTLKRFHSASQSLFPKNVTYSFDQLLSTLASRKGQVAFIESFGLAINSVNFPNSKLQSAMYSLAQRSQGKIPSKNSDFFLYLQNEGAKIDFVDAVSFVTKESVKDIVIGAQAVGDSILFTGKILNFALPVIVGVIVYFWVMKQK